MNSPRTVTISVTPSWLRAVASQMRRITPQDHETDEWISSVVHWFETLADNHDNTL